MKGKGSRIPSSTEFRTLKCDTSWDEDFWWKWSTKSKDFKNRQNLIQKLERKVSNIEGKESTKWWENQQHVGKNSKWKLTCKSLNSVTTTTMHRIPQNPHPHPTLRPHYPWAPSSLILATKCSTPGNTSQPHMRPHYCLPLVSQLPLHAESRQVLKHLPD